MAAVLSHALAPEILGENAPAERGSAAHVGVVHSHPLVITHQQLALTSSATVLAALGRGGHHHRVAPAAALASCVRVDGSGRQPGGGLGHSAKAAGRCGRPPALPPARGVGLAANKQQSPRLTWLALPPPPL